MLKWTVAAFLAERARRTGSRVLAAAAQRAAADPFVKVKKMTTADIEHKTAQKQDETQALTVKKEDLEGTQKALDAALAYFGKLKPSCVDTGVSYGDRVA